MRIAAYCRVSTDKEDQLNSCLLYTSFITFRSANDLQGVFYAVFRQETPIALQNNNYANHWTSPSLSSCRRYSFPVDIR